MVVGAYPADYNPKVHGPYDPSRKYGKADIAFKDVKLGEFGSWMSRRSMNPFPSINRAYWGWMQRWVMPKRPGAAWLIQATLGMSFVYYVQTYPMLKYQRHTKYPI